MANTHETIADIIAEKRREADYIEETARGSLKAGENYDGIAYTESDLESALDLADTKRKEADRIEAAHKREQSQSWHHREMEELVLRHEKELVYAKKSSGDAAKLREALSDACYAMFNFLKAQYGGYEEMANALDKAKAALSAPPRNCDVGTAEEQEKRFHDFCRARHLPRMEVSSYCAYKCPLEGDTCCELQWAQMPYKKGETK